MGGVRIESFAETRPWGMALRLVAGGALLAGVAVCVYTTPSIRMDETPTAEQLMHLAGAVLGLAGATAVICLGSGAKLRPEREVNAIRARRTAVRRVLDLLLARKTPAKESGEGRNRTYLVP